MEEEECVMVRNQWPFSYYNSRWQNLADMAGFKFSDLKCSVAILHVKLLQ